jgi:hypothetical protein
LKFSEKFSSKRHQLSKQMPDKFAGIHAPSQLFEIIFRMKPAQISGFQMKKQRIFKKA